MNKVHLQELVRRLEGADRLSNAERVALVRDIERYARQDLYGAARLCKDHLNQKADLRLPTAIMAAERIGKHFEMRTKAARGPMELYGEQDRQIRQPEDGRQYRGPLVGTTPNCVIQRDLDTGDYIVHARRSLVREFIPDEADKAVSIHYPFKAVGGVGLVAGIEAAHGLAHEAQHGLAAQHGHAQGKGDHSKGEHSMEMSR